jgi:hypothetical protein
MGVNKHNLQIYTKTFEFIHKVRRKTSVRNKMFERILVERLVIEITDEEITT